MTPRGVAWLLLLAAGAGCESFGDLRSGERSVTEEEVFRAGRSADRELTDPLVEILDRRPEYADAVVAAAVSALAERGDGAALPRFLALVRDPSEEVRFHVAAALQRFGGEQARAALAAMAAEDPSELVRAEARGAAARGTGERP